MKLTGRGKEKVPGMMLALVAIMGMSICAIAYTFSEGISGNDFWWHVKVGQWVVENKSVPTTDIFSWYGVANPIPWTAHEWLADVIFYFVHSKLGQMGVFAMSILAALLMFGLLWHEAGKYVEKNILVGGLFFVLLAVTTNIFFYGRPHLFSFFLLYWELKVLFAFVENPKSRGIYTVPLITCLWSNIHGGCASISYVLCGVFLIVCSVNVQIGKIESSRLDIKARIKLLIITICAVGAILVNPVGLEVLVYPYKSFGDELQMTLISEWRAPDAKNIGDLLLFYCPIVLLLIGFLAEEKRIRLIDLVVMALFVFLFVRSVRFIMLWYIAAAFCALPYVPECRIKPMTRKSEQTLIMACLLAFLLVIGMSGKQLCDTVHTGTLISTTLSDDAVAAVKKDAPKRLFNDYNLGEALIYHDVPVYFDARADLYAYDNLMADGVSMLFLEQANADAETAYADVNQLIEKYQFDGILILKTRALYAYLISHPDQFACVYEDSLVGYFRVIQ